MMKMNTIFICLFMGLTFCKKDNPSKTDCQKLNNEAMDSLMVYKTQFNKKKSTLESILNMLDNAIKCDSNLNAARLNRITVLNELGEYRKAIEGVNEFMSLKNDSSLLLLKASVYSKLNETDSAIITYKIAMSYFNRKLEQEPRNPNIIYSKIFAKSKILGKDSVRSDIDFYFKKYPEDVNLKLLLESIIQ